MNDTINLLALSTSDVIIITLIFIISFTQKGKTQLKTIFLCLLACLVWWVTPLIFKILLKNTSINPYTFECISGIGNYFLPVLFLALANIYSKTKIKIKLRYLLLFVLPLISSILLITNEHHHLLFVHFSQNFNEIVYGKFYYITIIYMYSLYLISMGKLLISMFRNSSLFSKQSLFLIIGSAIPLVINILGTLKVITITTYTTPITFSLTLLFYSFAIFKFNFLKTTPIALQKVVDRISDSYMILNDEYQITDFNKTFLSTFKLDENKIIGKNIFDFFDMLKISDSPLSNTFKENLNTSSETTILEQDINSINKTFTVEINHLFSENSFIGVLVLFKDITQHKIDMETIQNNQDMLVERERLASLGQMVGGIAHSLKTPIFSLSGGLEGLTDLINEFDESIEDPTVNDQDMHDIAKDMMTWIEKMRGHLSYMSEVITTVKGQAVTLSGEATVNFTISEVFSHTNILMKHELQNALVTLEIENSVPNDLILNGNVNSLVQVLNNLISNAIQAYNKKPNEKVELKANLENNNVIIAIKDYGPGLPEKVKSKLFKEMITTKGKEGTGLGLFMSYSMIKAKFNGDITFETSEKGTTFYIILPI